MSQRPTLRRGAWVAAHVLRVGWRAPQPATIRPSKEDVEETLRVRFGDPEEAEEAEEERRDPRTARRTLRRRTALALPR